MENVEDYQEGEVSMKNDNKFEPNIDSKKPENTN